MAVLATAPLGLTFHPALAATALVARGVDVQTVEDNFSASPRFEVATFTPPPCEAVASIDWGDGLPNQGTISVVPGAGDSCQVWGFHFYHEGGRYTITTTITAGAQSATVHSTASVTDLALRGRSSGSVSATGCQAANLTVGSFTDADTVAENAGYSATIAWGDGSVSAGTISPDRAVSGTHTYASGGTRTIAVHVADNGGASADWTTTAAVTPCPAAALPRRSSTGTGTGTGAGTTAAPLPATGDPAVGDAATGPALANTGAPARAVRYDLVLTGSLGLILLIAGALMLRRSRFS